MTGPGATGITTGLAVTLIVASWGVWAFQARAAEQPSSLRKPPSPAASFKIVAHPDLGRSSLRVLNWRGEPLQHVRVNAAPAHARQLRDGSSHEIGATGPGGEIDLPPLTEDREHVVSAPGHRSVALPRIAAGHRLEVNLRVAAQLRLRCRDRHGAAVAGVRLVVSKSAIADVAAVADAEPGGHPLNAIYATTSGADGTAVLDGLDRATYGLAADHPALALIDGPRHAEVTAPGDVELTFDEPVGRVLRCDGGRVVAAGTRYAHGALLPTLKPLRGVARIRAALQQQYPGAYVEVVMRRPSAPANLTCTAVALVAGRGFVTFETSLVPLSRTDRLVANLPTPEVAALGDVRVSMPASVSLPVPGQRSPRLQLVRRIDGVACSIPVQADTPIRLPAGSYHLDMDDPLVKGLLARRPPIAVVADGSTVVEVALGDLVPVPLIIDAADGEVVGSCAVGIRRDGRRLAYFPASGPRRTLFPPPGECELEVDVLGYRTASVKAQVRAGSKPDPMRLSLRPGAWLGDR